MVIDTLGRVNQGGGPRPGAGQPVDPAIAKFRKRWREFYTSEAGDKELLAAQRKEPTLRHTVLRLVFPNPIEPTPAPAPSPPLLVLIGQNGGQVALGYAPQGIVPGMEEFMPREVRALRAPANGHTKKRGRK